MTRILAVCIVCAWASAAALQSVFELNADSFYSAIRGDEDVLVAFSGNEQDSPEADVQVETLDELAARLGPESGVRVCTFNVRAHGIPSGLHVHDLPAVVLFPAGRDPVALPAHSHHEHDDGHDDDHSHADHSETCAGGAPENPGAGSEGSCSSGHHGHHSRHSHHDSHGHSHADADHVGGAHASATVPALLRFLREHGSAPALVPEPTLADDFRGRDVFRALENGIAVVRSQLESLRAENAALKARLKQCMQTSSACKAGV